MIDYGNGMIFPDAWGQGPPDPPEEPEDDERFNDEYQEAREQDGAPYRGNV